MIVVPQFYLEKQAAWLYIPPPEVKDQRWVIRIKTYHAGKGLERFPGKKLANRYRHKILTHCGFGLEHTLYIWKHTGVTMAWRAGIPEASIHHQAGWLDGRSFKTYLKSLSLFRNEEIRINYPGLPD